MAPEEKEYRAPRNEVAVSIGGDPFDKVKGMIEELVSKLMAEQSAEGRRSQEVRRDSGGDAVPFLRTVGKCWRSVPLFARALRTSQRCVGHSLHRKKAFALGVVTQVFSGEASLREVSDVGPKSILDALKIPWKYIEHTSNTLIDE